MTICPTCGKGERAIWFCRRPSGECGLKPWEQMVTVDLPRPDVAVVQTEDGKSHVVISRGGKAKSYEIVGASPDEKVKGVVEKVISDRHTGEWLP